MSSPVSLVAAVLMLMLLALALLALLAFVLLMQLLVCGVQRASLGLPALRARAMHTPRPRNFQNSPI